MKEYKFVKSSEGMKGIKIGDKHIQDNINVLVEKYAQEGWEVFQFISLALDLTVAQIVFVRDKK